MRRYGWMNKQQWDLYQQLFTDIESGKISNSALQAILQERFNTQLFEHIINVRLGSSLLRLGGGNKQILRFLIEKFNHHPIATEARKKIKQIL